MQIHSTTSCVEFIDLLRERAIAANAAPAVIDQIDRLISADKLETDLEEAEGKLDDMKEIAADLLDDLQTAQEALEAMIKMAIQVAPADCGMYQSDIDDASQKLRQIVKQRKKYSDYA